MINPIKKFFPQGETSSHLFKTSFVYGFIALSLILTKILIARLYGQEELGIFTYFFSLIDIAFLFTSFGFAEALAKTIAEDNKKTKAALKYYFPFVGISTLFFIVLTLVITSFAGLNPRIKYFNFAFVLYLIVYTLFYTVYSFFRGFKKFVTASLYSLINRVIFVPFILFAFFLSLPFYWILIGMSLGVVFVTLLALPRFKKFLPWESLSLSPKQFFSLAFSLFLVQVSFYLLRDTSEIVIGRLLDFSSLGLYSAHTSFTNVIRLIAYVFPVIIMPMAVTHKYRLNEASKKLLSFLIPFSFLVLIASYFLVPFFYGKEYQHPLLLLFLVVSSSLLVLYAYFNSVFIGENTYSRFYLKIVGFDLFLSLFVNVLLNIFLIYRLGLIGAPLATSLTITLKIFLNFYAIKKSRKEKTLLEENAPHSETV